MPTFERPATKIAELSDEQRAKVEKLETRTDEINALRLQLVNFYKESKGYLPIKPLAPGKKVPGRMTVGDVYATCLADLGDPKKLRDKLNHLITWPEQRETKIGNLTERLNVLSKFEVALLRYQELMEKGGAWRPGQAASDEEKETHSYYRMRYKEQARAHEWLDEHKGHVQELEAEIDYARTAPGVIPETVHHLMDEYDGLFDQAKERIEGHPELYLMTAAEQLHEMKDAFDDKGRIVETAYVKEKMLRIQEMIDQRRPVFIHGELGSGKTELAKHLARRTFSLAHVERWEKMNPAPDQGDKQAYAEWLAHRDEEREALMISGHRGMETEQIVAARAIERKEAAPPKEILDRIRRGWVDYQARITAEAHALDQPHTQIMEEVAKDRDLYEKVYLEAYRSPLETKTVLGPLLQAMQDGRPVIIDEMNAIPHHVLIMLNDYLLRGPGETVTPPYPDAKPFKIKPGFCVTATGNYKPEDGKFYVGRQQIDAAFMSRFGVVSYDYLPMSRELEAPGMEPEAQREFRRKNELYHMLLVRMLNPDLSLNAPPETLKVLYKLSMVARVLQDVFSEREVGQEYFFDSGKAKENPKDILKENVLSLRHLIPVIEQWKKEGFTRELDDYLFLNYIERSSARPDEKTYLYQILRAQGDFFPEAKGWPPAGDRKALLEFNVGKRTHTVEPLVGMRTKRQRPPTRAKVFSPKEIIEQVFGPAPQRTEVTEEYLRDISKEQPEEEVTMEELEAMRTLAELVSRVDKESEGSEELGRTA